jgi:hypothetical protein
MEVEDPDAPDENDPEFKLEMFEIHTKVSDN